MIAMMHLLLGRARRFLSWIRLPDGTRCGLLLAGVAGLVCLGSVFASWARAGEEESIDFGRDIRPLLSDKCFQCHGPNEQAREGGFRLDDKESALGEADSGEHPIVPGDLEQSELYQRITSDDLDMRMPPEDSNKSLTEEEIAKIAKWIEQGAPWQGHWAYVPPRKAALPEVQQRTGPGNRSTISCSRGWRSNRSSPPRPPTNSR